MRKLPARLEDLAEEAWHWALLVTPAVALAALALMMFMLAGVIQPIGTR